MGVGPIEAVRKVLAQAGMTIDDVDVMELNEAFAAQVIPVCREVGVDPFSDKLNPHGGAIALGHPYGMTGARIMNTLLNDLETMDRDDRPRDDVRRRRPGHGHARRASELSLLALALALGLVRRVGRGGLRRRLADAAAARVRRHDRLAGGRVRRSCSSAIGVRGDVDGRSFGIGALAGLGGGVGLAAFYRALSLGTMSVVSPLVACGAVVPFALAVATGERPAVIALVGAVAALGGAVLASVEERRAASPERARAIVLAVVAAVALGLFVYFLGARQPRRRRALDARRRPRRLALACSSCWRWPCARRSACRARAAARGGGGRARRRDGERALRARERAAACSRSSSVLGSLYPVVTVLLAHVLLLSG